MTKFLLKALCVAICFSAFCIFISDLDTVSAICKENQIDINIASLTELDKLIGIGPVLAQRIIDSRTFSSIDDLIKVNGIGNVTLEKIKQQELACVADEKESDNKEELNGNENQTEETFSENISNHRESSSNILIPATNLSRGEVINLSESQIKSQTKDSTKDIKSKKIEFNSEKILIFGLITFGLFIAVLFLLKKLKKLKNPKTEFD